MRPLSVFFCLFCFMSCQSQDKKKHASKKKIEKIVYAEPKQAKKDTVAKTKPTIKKTIFPIEGTYVIENDDPSCEMTLILSYKADQLVYKLLPIQEL